MSKSDITVRQVVEAAIEVCKERGEDFVYQRVPVPGSVSTACRYSADGGKTGHCLFGSALIDKLGVEWGKDWEGQPIYMVLLHIGVCSWSDAYGVNLVDTLSQVQADQDLGCPYGELLPRLEDALASLDRTNVLQHA